MFAYLVACNFISIFDVSANTILQCYLFDMDISKHHGLDMRHVPASLTRFLAIHGEESNEKVNASENLNANLMA